MAFTVLRTPGILLSFSVLLLLHQLLLPAAVAQRNDIFGALAADACDCCDVSMTSLCCTSCLQAVARTPELGGESAPSSSSSALLGRFSGSDEEEGYKAEAIPRVRKLSAEGEAGGDSRLQGVGPWLPPALLPACRCCSQASDPALSRRLRLEARACCTLCRRLHLPAPLPPTGLPAATRRLHALRGEGGDDVSGEVVSKTVRSPVKRMTSMDCMCCMNSGISDCCSKCRIF